MTGEDQSRGQQESARPRELKRGHDEWMHHGGTRFDYLAGIMCEASGKELDPANAGGSQYMMRNGGAGRSMQPNM